MSDYEQTRLENFRRRYREGDTPWDAELPPPEILALITQLPPGRALDLGCGSGRACTALALAGWQVDGVDYVNEALELARERVRNAGVAARVRLFSASVTDLRMLDGPYDLAIDVGCLHGLRDDAVGAYHDQLVRLLRPGGLFALYAHLRGPADPADGPTGILRDELFTTFADGFYVEQVVEGMSDMAGVQRPSLWCYMHRT